MESRNYLMAAFFAATTLLAPMTASALSISDYMKQSGPQKTASYEAAETKAILASYNTKDPAILAKYGSAQQYGEVVRHYFGDVPKGGVVPSAFVAFQAELQSFLKDPQTTQADKDTDQVDDLVQMVIQVDMPADLAKVQKACFPSSHSVTNKPSI